MRKKIVSLLIAGVTMLAVGSFTACFGKIHKHEYDTWGMDETYHWKKCDCDKADDIKEAHSLDEKGNCDVCGLLKGTDGLEYTLSEDKNHYLVSGIGTVTDTDIVIASVYNGLVVKEIESRAFDGCDSLTSVTIPNSVTSIEVRAFYGCRSLTGVYITDIAAWCRIDFDNDMYGANPLSYGANLYLNNKLVTELVIPDGVTGIGDCAFYGCSSLTSMVISNSVTSIGMNVFRNCDSLTSVIIGDSVTNIGNAAFWSCNSLTSITVAEGNSVYHSAGNCIIETESKTLVVGCKTSVIPDGVTSIGESAFHECWRLTSIEIPDSVISIGKSAFRYCESLTSITFEGTVAQWNAIEKDNDWDYSVPAKKVVCSDGEVAI